MDKNHSTNHINQIKIGFFIKIFKILFHAKVAKVSGEIPQINFFCIIIKYAKYDNQNNIKNRNGKTPLFCIDLEVLTSDFFLSME
jgi:hypothetical protein